MEELNNKLLIHLNKWIENANNGNVNDSILLICFNNEEYMNSRLKNFENIVILHQFAMDNNQNKNKIFYFELGNSKIVKRLLKFDIYKILFIPAWAGLKSNEHIEKQTMESITDKYLYINKNNLYELITSELSIQNLRNMMTIYGLFCTNFLDFKYLEFVDNEDHFDKELHLLVNKKILISKFGILIYRIFSFDTKASTTKIGRYYAKNIGSRSKVFTTKTFEQRVGSNYKINSLRAYDLLKDEKAENIRKEIARNLLNLEEKRKLDIKTISQVTKLEIEIIKKLNEDILIDKI